MNQIVGRPRIGQWYLRWDSGELFKVIGRDPRTHSLAVQSFNGELDEIEEEAWKTLPLGFIDRPEEWARTGADVHMEYPGERR